MVLSPTQLRDESKILHLLYLLHLGYARRWALSEQFGGGRRILATESPFQPVIFPAPITPSPQLFKANTESSPERRGRKIKRFFIVHGWGGSESGRVFSQAEGKNSRFLHNVVGKVIFCSSLQSCWFSDKCSGSLTSAL